MADDQLTTMDLEVVGGVATVTFRNPPLNLVDGGFIVDLATLIGRLSAGDVQVAVFQSADPDWFLARADLALVSTLPEMGERPGEPSGFHQLLEALERLPLVTIAKIDGIARGAGSEVALALDLRIASTRSRLAQPEIGFGLAPGGGGLRRLARAAGRSRALEAIMTGRDYGGAEAAAMGWVDRAVDADELDDVVADLTAAITVHPPGAVARAKSAFVAVTGASDEDWAIEDTWRFNQAIHDPDAGLLMAAHLERTTAQPTVEMDLLTALRDARRGV